MEVTEGKILKENKVKVGFIGGGNIAYAIISGTLKAGNLAPSQLLASAPSDRNLKKLRVFECPTTHNNREVIQQCQMIVLACKPYQIPDVAKEVYDLIDVSRHHIVSTAAGLPIDTLEQYFPQNTRVITALPNVACSVGAGAVMMVQGAHATTETMTLAKALFEDVAMCFEVADKHLSAASGILGCGVAFCAMIAEAFSDAGVMLGLPRQTATQMAAQLLLGSGKLLAESGKHPGEVKDSVTSPAGSTIRGVHSLEQSGIRGAIMNAVEATTIQHAKMKPK